MDKLEFDREREKLSSVLDIINEVLKKEKLDLKKLYSDFLGERDELWSIADRKKLHISNLETSLDKPYFARIDFTSKEDGLKNSIYIGKNGIIQNDNVVVTDWRAPISSLYYASEVGQRSFETTEEIIKGDMSLKRQYEIEAGNLQEYFDVNLVSNDSLLQKYLGSNNDARLKSIVSTIQKEQNDVIRKKIIDNLIIQGVAGSGKTTVALHRIAYLVYNYTKYIEQNQYLVIGPNPVFLKYIKSVLPELDVDGVRQCTYEQYAQYYINENININSSDKKVIASISGNYSTIIDKFKCSMQYKKMLEMFLDLYVDKLASSSLMLGNFEVLSNDTIRKMFQSANNGYISNLNSQIELTIERLCRYVKENQDKILSRYGDYSYELFKNAKTDEEKNKMRSIFSKDRAEITKNCRTLLRKYFNKENMNAIKLYKLFVSSIFDFDIFHFEGLNDLKNETMINIKNNFYDFEDLAALIYIKSFLFSNKDNEKIKHVVIDEAQDLGEFNFFTLKHTLPSATFSIFGDLAQSIYDYRGINDWETVNKTMFNNEAELIHFNKSYRTTSEIMKTADDVAESIGLWRSDIVVRHGEEVQLTKIEQEQEIPKYIAKKIHEYQEKGYKTIAVISKTDALSKLINNELLTLGIDIPDISTNDDLNDEKFSICTISNQLAKGLEFDAVIINNANEYIYSSNNNLDMKLLYVAITRALHELNIVYSDRITKPLESNLNKYINKSSN